MSELGFCTSDIYNAGTDLSKVVKVKKKNSKI